MNDNSIGLCLSGGGYRAMLFHTGALWRLNELGFLPRLDYVSSVSGGSITAGVLARAWPELEFTEGVASNFGEAVVRPIRALAGRTLDIPVVLRGLVKPWRSVGEELAKSYRRHLFGDLTVPELADDGPRFVFTATNLQDGELWWFFRRAGNQPPPEDALAPAIPLATAVAASSAFPPFLSPVVVPTGQPDAETGRPGKAVLSDAGVYDNLGLDPVVGRCGTVLVSDAGKRMPYRRRIHRNWAQLFTRVVSVMDRQVRHLRTGSLIKSYVDGEFGGAYWSSYSDIDNFDLTDTLPAPRADTRKLAESPTRLSRTPDALQQRLINWGYAICDAGIRRWVDPEAKAPEDFPYPAAGIA
ncbi:patatin-like phospholipase family protein [Amycolatopsis anabasis]|uniref:patatin-like phospholipase family protein n=1 Tax=Amycolatopsis anabasis TaxID=1840409 RepID=UPI00131C9E7B|nr:patatin-like phospholipase family protein [Amycolatopsis anabasis]